MLTFKRKPWTLTLLVSLILAISFASVVVDAKDFERRDHAVLKRFVKKRSPQTGSPLGLGNANDTPVGAAEDPADKLSTAPSGSAIIAAPSVELPPSLSPSLPIQASESPAPSAASQSSEPASVPPSQSPSAPSQSAASQSNAAPSSPPPAASTPPPPPPSKSTPENQPPSDPEPSESGKKGTATVFRYQTQSPSPSAPPQKSGNTSAARVSITVIAVIAGVVGAIAIAWTIFRKWKLRSSKKFDERLNPIDWQPSSADDGDLPGARRHSAASSFHSGSGHSMNRGYGATNHGGSIPDHDFTAGAALSPGGGYADMARGPSPQPQMMETNAYGANMYSHHDQYGVPLHHQGYGGPNYYNGNRPY